MLVYLLRHGVAQEGRLGQSDADRSLTNDGKRKLREVLHVALDAGVRPTLILTSPLKRAIQTAGIAKEVLNYPGDLTETKTLLPGSTVEQIWEEIRVHRQEQELMLVGHDPLFSTLPGFLLNTPSLRIEFKKGALMRIDFDRIQASPHGTLRWYLIAKLAVRCSQNGNALGHGA